MEISSATSTRSTPSTRTNGTKVRSVPNQTGVYNGDPDVVALPVGTYRVKAEAYGVGWVSVPIVIERDRTTVVDLNGEWWTDHPLADRAVTLPNGSVIGAGVSRRILRGEDRLLDADHAVAEVARDRIEPELRARELLMLDPERDDPC